MTFEEIVSGQVEGIVTAYDPLLEDLDEFIRCTDCGRLVRARDTAIQLHEQLTCGLYRAADEVPA